MPTRLNVTAAHESNLAAIDETAELGAATLVLVPGGLPGGDRDLSAARARAAEAIAALVPYAQDLGVRLGIEPMHPMYAADRGVVSTLEQALDIAEQFPADVVGVVVDTFHVWWEPGVEHQIARAAGRITSYQVCDWITPLPADALLSRGMVGDGHIDFATSDPRGRRSRLHGRRRGRDLQCRRLGRAWRTTSLRPLPGVTSSWSSPTCNRTRRIY